MHDSFNCKTSTAAQAKSGINPYRLGLQGVLLCTLFSLGGCVGAWVDMPVKQESTTAARQQLIEHSRTPVITRTEKTAPRREWCGTTVLLVIVPIPLKLPVCESYGNAIAYGKDMQGLETPLLYSSQKISSDFHACGPFMFLGPLLHSYEGNAICGSFR